MAAEYPGAIWAPADRSNYGFDESTDFKAIVIHTAEEDVDSRESTIVWFQNPAANVSMHFYISGPEGRVYQCVPLNEGAWGHGVDARTVAWRRPSTVPKWLEFWAGAEPPNLNLAAVGIEIEGRAETLDMDPRQWAALVKLVDWLCSRYGIPRDRDHIVGHSEINRFKSDPGPRFPWDRLMQGIKPQQQGTTFPPPITGRDRSILNAIFGERFVQVQPMERTDDEDRYILRLRREWQSARERVRP